MKKLRIVFMGTPEFSVPVLEGLIAQHEVIAVVTQPDRQVGRHLEVKFSPVKEVAVQHQIPVFQPEKIGKDYEMILALKPDMIITCAYGQFIPKAVLDYPKYHCINVHASLLPKLRGGAPIHHAIIENYPRTGITIMYMAEKMDSGDILAQDETMIAPKDTTGTLHDRLSLMGRDLLLETIPKLIQGKIAPIAQDESKVTYAWNIKREDEHIDFGKTSLEIYNRIRGLNPFPGAYALLDDKVVKIYASRIEDRFYTTKQNGEIAAIYNDGIGISTQDGELVITEWKLEGKKQMKVRDYLLGQNGKDLLGKVLK